MSVECGADAGSGSGSPRPAGKACRILVAEDDRANALYVEAVITYCGCSVRVVGNGQQAVEAASQENWDLILLDVHMPVMGGLQAANVIRDMKVRAGAAHTPIVAITASALPAELEQCRGAGMDDVLVKPFHVADLQRMLGRWAPGSRRSIV